MLTRGQKEKIIEFSKKCVEKNDRWHRFDHLEMVAQNAIMFAKKEGADPEVCEVAALLHDICKAEPGDHGTAGACKAREFLLSIGADGAFADAVAEAIHFHDKESRDRSPESAVLWDSDKLYILTPKGFVTRMCPFWLAKLGEEEGLKKAIYEYYFFLERLNTKTARELAGKHSGLMERLIKELKK
ncbi:MAG: HD domain-containing protein [Candidatus ainarchaeum sp.]|nr:HD domain-containing protein [Candidatus ainarchaeum sp.]MDD5096768.1 HD domain-containing protein [Candidatus ainarchaeum sp.]